MSIRLRDLIKNVRGSKTAAEERAVIQKECAAIRTSFKEEDAENRHRNVAKLLYIHMLGYPTHFGQMECLKLIVAPGYTDKRIGYLGLMLLLDENQEVLMLVTNSLKNDLNHPNQFIVGLALTALGNIGTTGMARDTAPEVEKLLASTNPYIRKKAALAAIRVLRKVPELLDNFVPRIKALLTERNHGVLLTGVTLMVELTQAATDAVLDPFRKLVPSLVRILKNLVLSGYAPEHDVSGVTDPFLQVKILRLLRMLGKGDSEASDQMNDILAQVATNTESTKNVGNAILYEAVQTIMTIEAEPGLRVMAINILGRFLLNRDNNIRYVALNTLSKVVNADVQAVQRHRNTIVDCLKDPDVSIRRRALDLIYSLVNESNIRILVRELLNFLLISDVQFRPELVAKLCIVTEKYAPSKRWHVDTILRVMSIAGAFIPDEVPANLVALISSSPELHSYAVQKLYLALTQDSSHGPLTQVAVWCIGEFGDLLVADKTGASEGAKEGDESISITVSEGDVVDLVEQVVRDPLSTVPVRQYALTSLMKLTTRFSPSLAQRIKATIETYRSNLNVELQQRSVEYSNLFRWEAVRTQVLDRMPVLEPPSRSEVDGAPAGEPVRTPAAAPVPVHTQSAPVADLLGDLLGMGPTPTPTVPTNVQPKSSSATTLDLLGDLFGPSPTPAPAQPSAATNRPPASMGLDIMDLLGGPAVPTTIPSPSMGINSGMGGMNLGLGATSPHTASPHATSPQMSAQTSTPTSPQPGSNAFTGYNKQGVTIVFEAAKQPGAPQNTVVQATYTNANGFPLSNFSLQAAVPKHLKIQMAPPSGNAVPASNAGKVTQLIRIQNSEHGSKPIILRLKIDYVGQNGPVSDMADVNFPAGL
eukprot:TRINITY_DN1291_c0_g1_i4.p1 TRINITY_DN1291_c0_g1~~TRINITY_DN1291_c0_g1_i4.p1  ORF type:complete len:891 (-),score=263.42 TRINITY_DN1291_c0_g1_i4:85-2706(-)